MKMNNNNQKPKWSDVQSTISLSNKMKRRKIEFQPASKASNAFGGATQLSSNTSSEVPKKSIIKKNSVEDGLFPVDTVAKLMKWKKVTPCGPGLFNHGNTCFLNSTLQCLFYIPAFNQILMEERAKPTGTTLSLGSSKDGQQSMLRLFASVVAEAHAAGTQRAISPRCMSNNIRRIGKQFRQMRQEDAHEYLRQLLDCFHEEILKANKVKVSDGKIAETTLISRVFGGYLRNELKCSQCGYCSQTFNHFQDLSLEITGQGLQTINDAVRTYVKPERLGRGNEWKCSKCNKLVQATKQMTIHDAPMVLVLHLKRFAFGSFSGKASKHIKFNQFLELPVSNETKGKTDGNKASEQHANKGHKNAGMRNTESYELCGMIVHHGSSVHSGHYVAYIKAPNGQWHEMNDSSVSTCSIHTVLKQQAYVLFYTKCVKPSEIVASSVTGPAATVGKVIVNGATATHSTKTDALTDSLKIIKPSSSGAILKEMGFAEGKEVNDSNANKRSRDDSSSENDDTDNEGKTSSTRRAFLKPIDNFRVFRFRGAAYKFRDCCSPKLLQPLRPSGALSDSTYWPTSNSTCFGGPLAAIDSDDDADFSGSDDSSSTSSDDSSDSDSSADNSPVVNDKTKFIKNQPSGRVINYDKMVGAGTGVRSQLIGISKRRQDAAAEGQWEMDNESAEMDCSPAQSNQVIIKQKEAAPKVKKSAERRKEMEDAAYKRDINTWNAALDQGRQKKVKNKDAMSRDDMIIESSYKANPFQQVQNASKRAKDKMKTPRNR